MQAHRELVDALRDGRVAVFVGSGASAAAGLPSWDELATALAAEMKLPIPPPPLPTDLLLRIPQYYENRLERRELMRALESVLAPSGGQAKRNHSLLRPIHHYVAQLPTTLFYTTNLDSLLEDELDATGVDYDLIDNDGLARQHAERRRCQVRKLHGSIKGDWDDVVVTRGDYANLEATHSVLLQSLAEDLKTHTFLFVGYSLRDPDFSSIYERVLRTMHGKQQAHYIALVNDPGQDELTDLRRRGLVPLALWDADGATATEKCVSFLKMLVEQTSERFHLKRFYRGFDRGDSVPIVVTSRLHESENYVFYPECDIHVASQIKDALRKIHVDATIRPDAAALRDPKGFLSGNLVLVCSPFGNRFTKHVFDQNPSWARWTQESSHRAIEIDGREYRSDDPAVGGQAESQEYALIARFQSPYASGRYIYVFAGVQALGTQVIGDFLEQRDAYNRMGSLDANGDFVALLRVSYAQYDPLEWQYKLEEVFTPPSD